MATLRDLIRDKRVLVSLDPEELAYQVLQFAKSHLQNGMVHAQTLQNFGGFDGDPDVELAAIEAWQWLELNLFLVPAPGANGRNGWRVLGRRAKKALTEEKFADYRRAAAFPRELLHPAIVETVWPALARGDFDVAVLYAFRTVEEAVRAAGSFGNEDYGLDLMRDAFKPKEGKLTWKDELPAEQLALLHLFQGAIGSYKNPRSHRTVVIKEALEAQEMVMLASHLLRIVDARKPN